MTSSNNYLVKTNDYISICEITDIDETKNFFVIDLKNSVEHLVIINKINLPLNLKLINTSDLKIFKAPNCLIRKLNISDPSSLINIDIGYNQLQKLSLSKSKKLEILICQNNILDELIINSKYLIDLMCQNNMLKNLNVRLCDNLIQLMCFNNRLNNLDLSNLSNLEIFDCSFNQIFDLDTTNCSNLKNIYCSHNNTSNLLISDLDNLLSVYCTYSNIKLIDVSRCPKLNFLVAFGNSEPKIKMGGCFELNNIKI